MTKEDVLHIISTRENISVELKSCEQAVDPTVYESVCAFLNRLGGTIIMGVHDDGEVCGIDDRYIRKVQNSFVNQINNPEVLNPITYIIPEVVEMDGGKNVVVLNVPESPQVHTCLGHFYDRNDEGDMDITGATHLISAMYLRKMSYSSERIVIPELTIDDFDENAFNRLRLRVKLNHLWKNMPSADILRSGGFWQRDPQTGKEGYILAALLLFGKEESLLRTLPYYKTSAVYYNWDFKRNVKPTMDVMTTFYDDHLSLTCNLIELYERLYSFIQRNTRNKEVSDETGRGRISLRDLLFREILSNFIIHREYYYNYAARILIYNDRFITENWTKQIQRGAVTVDTLVPNVKNPIITHVFELMDYYEGVGKGMKRIKELTPRYHEGAYSVIDNEDLFRLTLMLPKGTSNDEREQVEGTSSGQVEFQVNEKEFQVSGNEFQVGQVEFQVNQLTGQVKALIQVVDGEMSIQRIMESLRLSVRRTVLKVYLTPAINQGLIEMTQPNSPKSPTQKYRLTEKGKEIQKLLLSDKKVDER